MKYLGISIIGEEHCSSYRHTRLRRVRRQSAYGGATKPTPFPRFLLNLFFVAFVFSWLNFSGGIIYGQNIIDVSLDSLLNTRISTAAKYAQKTSEAAASITIITSDDIKRYGYQTLEDVFKSVRGFYVTNDRNYTYLGVRGFSRPTDYNDRILLLINGHTVNEDVYGSALIGTEFGLDLDIIERIEIVRGPGSALYGTGAMFAVVNIITKQGNMVDGFKPCALAGSYGKLQGAAMFGKEFSSGVDIFISGQLADIKGQNLYFPEYNSSSTNYGIAENLDWDKYYGILTTIGYKDFDIQGIFTSRKKGIPTGAFEIIFNHDSTWTLDERSFVQFKFARRLNANLNFLLRGYFDWYHYKGAYPYDILSFDESYSNWLGSETQFLWDIASNNRLAVGLEYQNHLRADYRLWDAETTYFDQSFPFNLISSYLQDEYQLLTNLSVNLGIRYDKYSTVGSSFTPRGAIVYNPLKSTTLKLLYGQAFRAPNVYEANYEDPLAGFKSNPNLKPEKIRTYEIVWEQRFCDELFGTVSFYDLGMKDLIDQAIDSVDSLTQFQNLGKVSAIGLEFELKTQLKNGTRGYVNYAFQNAKDDNTLEKLTNSPSHAAKFGFVYPLFKYFLAAAEMQYETERITVYRTKTDSYFLINMNLSTTQLFNHLRISFLVRNLLNTTYKLPGGFEHRMPAIAQNGRNFGAKVEFKF